MTVIPTIATERLFLRPMSIDDWEPYAAFMRSERARHMGGPFGVSAAWGMFCADHAQWDLLGSGALMIENRESGHCLGQGHNGPVPTNDSVASCTRVVHGRRAGSGEKRQRPTPQAAASDRRPDRSKLLSEA